MTASTDAAKQADDLPAALPSMWRSLKLGYRAEPGLLSFALGMSLFATLPDGLMALWLKLFAQGVLEQRRSLAIAAALALGASTAGTWFLRVISDRVQRRFRDRVTIALEAHVARLQATVPSVAHHERPEYLDRLAMLRDQVFVLDHMYMSLFSTLGFMLLLCITLGLLASIHPALLLLALFALPAVITSTLRPSVDLMAQEKGAPEQRLARHLFVTGTSAAPGKEVRVTRTGERLVRARRAAWDRWYAPLRAARNASALYHVCAWAVFGLGYAGAVTWVATRAQSTPAEVLLVLAAGARLSGYVGATVSEIGFLRGFWLHGARRLAWLEDYASALQERADTEVPARLAKGIALDHVSFEYPGTGRRVLEDVSLDLRAGSVVALVGENGAGKSTLVKLLCKLYEPSAGAILVDGAPLGRMRADRWRARTAGAFQDFFRFELLARQSVGVGDLPRLDDAPAVGTAVERAGAEDVVQRLGHGLDTQLGPTWPGGAEVSFGQWQKLALARGFMRDHPLLLVLDEPTAALDAETEHALFERFSAAAKHESRSTADDDGRITLLVSHRFSTVRMADQIVVLDGSRVCEVGSHAELMAHRGKYAELYTIQAAAYR